MQPLPAAKFASETMKRDNLKKGGACFACARITDKDGKKYEKGQKYVEVAKAGDVKALIFRKGKLIWESHDDSIVQSFIDSKSLEPGGEYYFPGSNIVTKSLSAKESEIELLSPMSVESGDLVLVLSDGITDNITPREIEKRIKGLTPKGIIQLLSGISGTRMANAQEIIAQTDAMGGRCNLEKCSDGYLSLPKPDNRGIAIIEVK
jgi:serine/threonine protein phosphatase PrpC